jgi:hypothetical protein
MDRTLLHVDSSAWKLIAFCVIRRYWSEDLRRNCVHIFAAVEAS